MTSEYLNKNKVANLNVGDGVTLHIGSDAYAYTIIKKTAQSITCQQDKATLSKDFVPDVSMGGFFCHVHNSEEQSYTYERDPQGEIIVAHWSEKKRGFFWKNLRVTAGRHQYYDYNF